MKGILIYALISFAIALVLSPLIFWLLKKMRAKQEILHYVDWHKAKSGTPTMGGWIFILPTVLLACFLLRERTPLSNIALIGALCYGILGFLDDFINYGLLLY